MNYYNCLFNTLILIRALEGNDSQRNNLKGLISVRKTKPNNGFFLTHNLSIVCSAELTHRFTLIYFSHPSSHPQGQTLRLGASL